MLIRAPSSASSTTQPSRQTRTSRRTVQVPIGGLDRIAGESSRELTSDPSNSDYGSLTLLFQRSNGGEGLQILPSIEAIDSENWKDTGLVDDALLVNIGAPRLVHISRRFPRHSTNAAVAAGDALELWSGAIFKSTLHRVRPFRRSLRSLHIDARHRSFSPRPSPPQVFPSGSQSPGSTNQLPPRHSSPSFPSVTSLRVSPASLLAFAGRLY
jgi:hypothetical protein